MCELVGFSLNCCWIVVGFLLDFLQFLVFISVLAKNNDFLVNRHGESV